MSEDHISLSLWFCANAGLPACFSRKFLRVFKRYTFDQALEAAVTVICEKEKPTLIQLNKELYSISLRDRLKG